MQSKKSFFLLALVFLPLSLNLVAAEKNLSNADFLKKIISYNTVYRQEKAYVHTDKPAYFAGETIWLSAYIMNIKNNNLNKTEKVVYVDLIKPSGKILKKHILKVESGRAVGQIKIRSHYPSGTYYLLAYTNWMRNTGSDFYYKKPILILNDSEEKNETYGNLKDNVQNPFPEPEDSVQETSPELSIRFFPEGGDLIDKINTRVAFEATSNAGTRVSVSGYIKDDSGSTLATISSLWEGKGYFFLTPEFGKEYYAEIAIDETLTLQFVLPEVKKNGYSLKLESAPKSDRVLLSIGGKGDDSTGAFFLLAMQNNYPVYALSDSLSGVKTYAIPLKDLNTGIVQFTIFDHKKRPRCERLFFVNKNDKLNIEVLGSEFEAEPRGKISLELQVKDKNQIPVEGSFSLAITDAWRIVDSFYEVPDFLSNFYIGAYLPGINYDLGNFLASSSKNYLKTELLMLTNGWRRYEWEEVLKDTIEIPTYLEEPGIYVKGKLYKKNKKKKEAPDGLNVTMMLPKRFDTYTQLTDENGGFTFLVQDFTDTMKAVLQTKNKMNLKRDYYIDIETNVKSKPVDIVETNVQYGKDTIDFTGYFESLRRESLKEELRNNYLLDLYIDTTDVQIDEVTVIGTKNTDVKGEIIKRYGAPEQTVGKKQLMALNEEKSWNWGLMSIMEDAIPGLDVFVLDDSSVRFTPTDRRRHRFFIFVDGDLVGATDAKGILDSMHSTYYVSDLIGLDATIVKSVDLIYPKEKNAGNEIIGLDEFYSKVITDIPEGGNNLTQLVEQSERYTSPVAILSIYTQDGKGLFSRGQFKGMLTFSLTGYSKTKEFYVPDYANPDLSIETDERTTLYWNPNVKTDASGKAKIEFYNSDKASMFRADVVGISEDGIPGDHRVTFGNKEVIIQEAVMTEPTDSGRIIFYENPEDMPEEIDGEDEIPVWVNPTKVKVLVRKPDGDPAVFADVSVKHNSWGNTSDQEGIFYLDLALIREADSVFISYKGEAQKLLRAEDILQGDTSVTLEALHITPSSEDGEDLAKKAIRRILSTRNGKTTFGVAAYREQIYINDKLHSLFDANMITRVPNIRETSINYGSRVLKGQWFKTDNYDNKALFYPKVNNIFGIQIMDPAFNTNTFLKIQHFKNYVYVLEGLTTFMNRRMYKITFDQVDDLKWTLSKGFMLVDKKTMGIAYVEWGTSPKGAKFIVPDDYLMGGTEYHNFLLQTDVNTTSYRLSNKHWELKSARQDVSFKLNDQDCAYSREQHFVEYRKDLPFKMQPSRLEDLDKRFMLIRKPVYNPKKWRIPWFLPINKHISENMPYLREVLILTDPEVKFDLMNIDQ